MNGVAFSPPRGNNRLLNFLFGVIKMARNSGLLFRMENMDAAAAGGDADESLAINADASQAVEEVESATGDVTEVDTGIENAQAAQGELGEVTDLVEEAVQDGDGLSPREAAHVEARLEHIASLLGTTAAGMGLTFRRESFGGTASRLAATKMRLEAMKEWGSKIWEAIKKGWQWLKDAIANLISKITGNLGAVEKRLKDLKGRAEAIDNGAKAKKDKLSVGAKLFSVGGEISKATIEKVLVDSYTATAMITAFNKNCAPEKLFSVQPTALAALVRSCISEGVDTKITTLPKGNADGSVGYGNLPNNTTLIFWEEKKTVGGEQTAVPKVSFGPANEKTAEDYSAFSKADLISIADDAIVLVGELKAMGKIQKEVEALVTVNIRFCEDRMKAAGNIVKKSEEKDEDKTKVQEKTDGNVAAIQGFAAIVRTVASTIPTLGFKAAMGAGDLIEAGVNNMKAEEKKKD